MFNRTKGFVDCIPPHTCSSQLLRGGNPFPAFGKSTLEKQINTKITAGRCLFCLNSSCSGRFNNTEILAAKPLPSPSSHPKTSSSAVNWIQRSSWETDPGWEKKKKTAAFFSLIFLFFGKGSVVSQAWCFTTPEQWRWHKVGQHPVVLGMEGLHGVAQAQITASAASYCSC